MRILYVVQRYGVDVVGGSETAAREFAEHLVARGHHVEVLTSCATDYVDWANVQAPGAQDVNGVTVHRLPVTRPRDLEGFGRLHEWMVFGPRPIPMFVQQRWAREMGPDLEGAAAWLHQHHDRFDVAVFMTYLYSTTTVLLPVAARLMPVVLQPTAHLEPALRAGLFDGVFRLADGFLFFTPEERDLVAARFRIQPSGANGGVTGMGIDGVGIDGMGLDGTDADVSALLGRLGLDTDGRPFLLYLGRFDEMKGTGELVSFCAAMRRRWPGSPDLVLAGGTDPTISTDEARRNGIRSVGFLDESDKARLLARCLALVQPSRFESFSIVLCEAWLAGRPAIVHADSDVLAGQARRSQGAVPYRGFAEFEAAVALLACEPELARQLGARGRAYVRRTYDWSVVIDAVEVVLADAIGRSGHA